jgi:hypothetical protein
MENAKHAIVEQLIRAYRYADESAAHAFSKIARQGKSRLTQIEIQQGLHNAYFAHRFKKALFTNNV